ncbi:MAG: hypothetical protein ACXAEX_11570 [Promethearchaeota archaeon]|jgi:hypothetical protein
MAKNNSNGLLRCGICRTKIIDRAQIHQAGINLGIICATCFQKFPPEDIEILIDLFTAFGGYYGMLDRSEFSILDSLRDMIEESPLEFDADEINLRLMYKALLHGLTPREFLKELRIVIGE